jgi:hypothetical protein
LILYFDFLLRIGRGHPSNKPPTNFGLPDNSTFFILLVLSICPDWIFFQFPTGSKLLLRQTSFTVWESFFLFELGAGGFNAF